MQGSDVSEQGSGLTPLCQLPLPVFAYREQGAVAGEGTAVQIGEIVSAAEVWKEISRPPYFVGYHGAYTQHAHRLIFAPGSASRKDRERGNEHRHGCSTDAMTLPIRKGSVKNVQAQLDTGKPMNGSFAL